MHLSVWETGYLVFIDKLLILALLPVTLVLVIALLEGLTNHVVSL
jgi:hypothetical protein